ncbi:MAG TPA: LamG-like jellyroll fold domain-containing protein [Candidatus Paceibacterota bacterium]|nr:LamG-like jellyroll fold domain-containing protein [Candidatus Paceibacterota bacterium]
MRAPGPFRQRKGFTLIELLVVIAIIAILAVVVVLTLNPSELLKQSRDSNRISDMATLSSALSLYSTDQSGGSGFSMGTPGWVYVSIPDPQATSTAGDQCQGLGLPTLPAGYAYHCAASSTVRSVTNAGWVPVNFAAISSGAPLSSLPLDPVNASSSRLYYTYETNGTQYEVTAVMESQKYKAGGSGDVITPDGGRLASVYEKGTALGLEPLDYGDASLVGFWPMDEGSGTVAYDDSGSNATGTWNGGQVGTASGYYSAGKIGSYAGAFDGSSTYLANTGNNPALVLTNAMTLVAWVKVNASGTDMKVISKRPSYVLTVFSNNIPETEIFIGGTSKDTRSASGGTTLVNGVWYQLAGTYNGSTLTTYVNGVLDRQISVSGTMDSTAYVLDLGKTADGTNANFNGLIDDARVYNRALSAAEIAALYNGGK